MGLKKLIDLDLLDRFLDKIKINFASSITISGRTISLKNKKDTVLGSVSVPIELPAITVSDNNKVLTVVNGIWAPAAPTGGGGSTPVIYTSTIPTTGWSDAEEYGVEQNISFTGVTFGALDPIFIDLNISSDATADDLLMNWDLLIRATPIANTSNVRIWMFSEPDMALPVRLIKF